MIDIEAVDVFRKVAEARSVSNAARLHGLPKSTVSHRLRQLEEHLGVELFLREGRSLALTDAGSEFLAHATRILACCETAETAVSELRQEIAGTLTVGSTGEFGTAFTSELLFSFRHSFPQIKLDVVFLNAGYLFSPDQYRPFDAIFHWGDPPDVDYVRRRLSQSSFGLYASPDYIGRHGMPTSPADLSGHRAMAYRKATGVQSWSLARKGESIDVLPTADLTATDYWMLKYFAVAGEGLAYLPGFFTEIECALGKLQRVLPGWQSSPVPINLLSPRRAQSSRKFSVFAEFCAAYYRNTEHSRVPRYYIETVR